MEWFRTIDAVAAGNEGPDRGSGIYSRLRDGRVIELHEDGDRVRASVVAPNATGSAYDDRTTFLRASYASFSEARRAIQARFGTSPKACPNCGLRHPNGCIDA